MIPPRDIKTKSVLELILDTVEGLGQLVGQHLTLARIELWSDLRIMSQQLRSILILAAIVLVGYVLGMAGLAVWMGGGGRIGLALLTVGFIHLVAGGVGLLVVLSRQRAASVLDSSAVEVSRSLTTLTAAAESPRSAASPRLP